MRYLRRIDRFTAFIVFPFMLWLTVAAAPIFHFLFGHKWDEAIPLFQILMIRGIFIVLTALYTNFLLARGKARTMLALEVVKDAIVVAALLATVWTFSLEWLVWGQLGASFLTWIVSLWLTRRALGVRIASLVIDLIPFAGASIVMGAVCLALGSLAVHPAIQLLVELGAGVLVYGSVLRLRGIPEIREAVGIAMKRL